MGKVSPENMEFKASRRKRRFRSSANKYLKPGALAQLRNNKASTTKSCTDLGKKRVAAVDSEESENNDGVTEKMAYSKSPLMLSPVNNFKEDTLERKLKTPQPDSCSSESRLESLPMDLLVKILCHLPHDRLKVVFHVSQRIRRATLLAKRYHFNYTTPDRSRQELLNTMTPRPLDHWPFVSSGDGPNGTILIPHTPKAPRHGPRPPSRIKLTELKQIAAVLFQDQAFPSRCTAPSVLAKPLYKAVGSNRVLFYEDELCQAVAENKLR